jgi:hypothetical protein
VNAITHLSVYDLRYKKLEQAFSSHHSCQPLSRIRHVLLRPHGDHALHSYYLNESLVNGRAGEQAAKTNPSINSNDNDNDNNDDNNNNSKNKNENNNNASKIADDSEDERQSNSVFTKRNDESAVTRESSILRKQMIELHDLVTQNGALRILASVSDSPLEACLTPIQLGLQKRDNTRN